MNKQNGYTILVIDDDQVNREILKEQLTDEGYQVVLTEDGIKGMELIKANPKQFDTILLDRMMPKMNGIDVLRKIKKDPTLSHLPIVMQTAKASRKEAQEGIEAGARYYLTKPFTRDEVLAIVQTTLYDYKQYQKLQEKMQEVQRPLQMMRQGTFQFRTMHDTRELAAHLSHICPNPEKVVTGLMELLINAVEHGNLGITYREKSKLLGEGMIEEEIQHRLELPENRKKMAVAHVIRTETGIKFLIRDRGTGFAWEKYLEPDPDRLSHLHGRGIAMANKLSFDRLEYLGCGNEVQAIVILPSEENNNG